MTFTNKGVDRTPDDAEAVAPRPGHAALWVLVCALCSTSVLVFPVCSSERNQNGQPKQSEVVCIPLLLVYTTFGAGGTEVSRWTANGVFHGDVRVDKGTV